ncbi:excisionase family DNA binding protein [Sinorhizobium fredii]|uniref:Uncharacterized protein n=1 Tax=Sinorhizobium fredii (strain USDA 257) TaxID=1185652 RepID=I3XBB1_SINF2|nr:helix-turn-helix domain-containing protein [Sinorhizobium fredii]AFL53167.1 hypothetical protein USDA257_c46290 [Sinorhizobium fredii USDA 257]
MNDTPIRKLMTDDDLADRWGCERETVLRRRKVWGLKGVKFGRQWRFRPEDVEECERRRVTAE